MGMVFFQPPPPFCTIKVLRDATCNNLKEIDFLSQTLILIFQYLFKPKYHRPLIFQFINSVDSNNQSICHETATNKKS